MWGKNLKNALLLTTLLLVFAGAKAQFLFSLSYDSLNFPSPNTQSVGSTIRYTFTIHNGSATTFQDSLYINIRSDSAARVLVAYDTVTITSGGIFVVDTVDTISLLRYGGGINILVIWPTSPSPISTDSITDTLFVLPVGVDDPKLVSLPIDVFPVPSQMDLFLRSRDPMLSISNTKILSLTGEVLRAWDGLPEKVSVAGLSRGIYFVEIQDRLGRVSRLKMVKQ